MSHLGDAKHKASEAEKGDSGVHPLTRAGVTLCREGAEWRGDIPGFRTGDSWWGCREAAGGWRVKVNISALTPDRGVALGGQLATSLWATAPGQARAGGRARLGSGGTSKG